MTSMMKYAGAMPLDDLEEEVKRGMAAPAPAPSQTQSPEPIVPHEAFMRFGIFNIAGFALLGAAWTRGWIEMAAAADQTGLTFAIFAVFVVGLVVCATKLLRVGREAASIGNADRPDNSWAAHYLRAIKGRDSGARAIAASALRLRAADWLAAIRLIANSLVLLGLIGTVVGFIIALSGVDPESVSDVKAISPMVSELLAGMSVALYTTLAGATLNLWLMVNHRLLSGATTRMVAALVERGEMHETA